MKLTNYSTLLLTLCSLCLLLSCGSNTQQQSAKKLTPVAFQTQLKANQGQLIDVRTPEEYQLGHLDGALNVDFYADDFQTKLEQLNKKKTVYVYCKSGGRSGKAVKKLESMGHTAVYDLKGGIMAWEKNQLDLVK